jgi:hypothetical protein
MERDDISKPGANVSCDDMAVDISVGWIVALCKLVDEDSHTYGLVQIDGPNFTHLSRSW